MPGPPKSRMITLRLSEEEFQKLQSLRQATGSRTVSQAARAAMQALLQKKSPPPLETRFQSIQAKLQLLETRLRQKKAKYASA
jgi:uncharacterized protein with PIN domain